MRNKSFRFRTKFPQPLNFLAFLSPNAPCKKCGITFKITILLHLANLPCQKAKSSGITCPVKRRKNHTPKLSSWEIHCFPSHLTHTTPIYTDYRRKTVDQICWYGGGKGKREEKKKDENWESQRTYGLWEKNGKKMMIVTFWEEDSVIKEW